MAPRRASPEDSMIRLSHISPSAPTHRLAPWARDPTSYRVYTTHPRRERTSGDYGVDNFSYDPSYLAQWQISSELEVYLTPELAGEVYNIMLAGSAVRTSVERIEALSSEAVHRLAPRSSHAHLLNRSSSEQSSAVQGAVSDTSSSSPLQVASPITPPIATALLQNSHQPPQLLINMIGMESPPFTPIDSVLGPTPHHNPALNSHAVAANMDVVSAQLSPLLDDQLTLTPNIKNNIAWETFINCVQAEIDDLKRIALARLRSFSSTFKTVCVEQYNWDGKLTEAAHEALMWWWAETDAKIEVFRTKAADLEARIARAAKALRIDDVDVEKM